MTTDSKRKIRKWVKALRSGEYNQGEGNLCAVDKDGNAHYCCLGVAYELDHGPSSWTFGKLENPDTGFPPDVDDDENATEVLKTSTTRRVDYYKPKYISSKEAAELMDMNDLGESFSAIANYLEDKYLND